MTEEEYLKGLKSIHAKVLDCSMPAKAGRLAWNLLENIYSQERLIERKVDNGK